MTNRTNKFIFASVGFGVLVFVFAFLITVNPFFFVERLLQIDSTTTVVQSLSTVRTLQAQHASEHQGKFAANFDELINTFELDEKFKGENPVVRGYIYTMRVNPPSSDQPAFYSINADPLNLEDFQTTETIHLYFDSTLTTIKFTEENRQANAKDQSL